MRRIRLLALYLCFSVTTLVISLTALAGSMSSYTESVLNHRSEQIASLGSGAAMANYYSHQSRTTATTVTANGYTTTTYTSGGQSYQKTTKTGGGSSRSSSSSSSGGGRTSWGSTVTGTFADMGGGEGGYGFDPPEPVCEDYTSEVYAPDYVIREVVPLVIKQDQRALVGVNIENIGRLDGTTNVTVSIGTESITMTNIKVPAGNHALSFGYFKSSTTGTPTVKVAVNTNHPAQAAPRTTSCNTCGGCGYSYVQGAEYDYANNSWTGTVNINKLPDIANPKDPAPRPGNPSKLIAELPQLTVSPTGGTGASKDTYTGLDGKTTTIGNNRTDTAWTDSTPTGTDKLYSAKLDMSVKVMDRTKACTNLKSGYGFSLEVTCTVTTDYPVTDKVEAPKKVLCYVPDWGDYNYAVSLERTDNGGAYARTTTWQLPVNTASGTQANKWYVPTWWSDKTDYNFLVAAKGVYTPGGELTAAAVQTIKIDSNMYTDDYSVN